VERVHPRKIRKLHAQGGWQALAAMPLDAQLDALRDEHADIRSWRPTR